MNESIKIQVINHSGLDLPQYKSEFSAGMDLHSASDENIILKPLQRQLVGTGISVAIPNGYEGQVRPRSGLALKHGITVLNTPGTIDADYRGEIGVILVNLSNEDFTIKKGERIAQLVITRHESAAWVEVNELKKTSRGAGGFGSTGKD